MSITFHVIIFLAYHLYLNFIPIFHNLLTFLHPHPTSSSSKQPSSSLNSNKHSFYQTLHSILNGLYIRKGHFETILKSIAVERHNSLRYCCRCGTAVVCSSIQATLNNQKTFQKLILCPKTKKVGNTFDEYTTLAYLQVVRRDTIQKTAFGINCQYMPNAVVWREKGERRYKRPRLAFVWHKMPIHAKRGRVGVALGTTSRRRPANVSKIRWVEGPLA